jgi:hydroxymethylbilane synthase
MTMSPAAAGTPTAIRTLRLGTRASALARVQTQRVIDVLQHVHPDVRCEAVVLSTAGDRDKQTPLAVIGGQGIFTKDLQRAILEGEIDCAVHSVKDLTSQMPEGLALAAVLERADPRDALISRHPGGLAGLPRGAKVGTSSLRRRAQLLVARPDLEAIELRGNIDTRLAKVLDAPESAYDAAILAVAGIERMGWSERITEYLDVDSFTPAPGQGALGVDCRADDRATLALLASIADPLVSVEIEAERAFLRAVGGGCRSPLAAHARVDRDGELIDMWAMYANEELSRIAATHDEADVEDAVTLAERLAEALLDRVQSA